MIYITGDTHGVFKRFSKKNFPEQSNMTKDDHVIICGDFGNVWSKEEDREEKYWSDWLEDKNFSLLFVDGNHENHERLDSYPVEEWNGGKIHRIREHILHLMRGQVYEIDGKVFFTFGGASSHDMTGGVLDKNDPDYHKKKKRLDKDWIPYRINRISWWEEELANEEEMEEGRKNLAIHNNTVDYIITHCCSTSTQELFARPLYKLDKETDYLEEIKKTVKYDKWFFGHYHIDRSISENEICLYERIVMI